MTELTGWASDAQYAHDLAEFGGDPVAFPPNVQARHRVRLGLSHAEIDSAWDALFTAEVARPRGTGLTWGP